MSHQPIQIDDAALNEPDGARPGVGIAVLKLEVDFLGAEAHKGELHLGLADADDEDFPAELDAVDGRVDAGFDARAFERDGRLDPAGEVDDLLGRIFDANAPFDFEGADAGHEFLCKGESALVNVRHDDWFRARGSSAQERDEADGSGAADQERVA